MFEASLVERGGAGKIVRWILCLPAGIFASLLVGILFALLDLPEFLVTILASGAYVYAGTIVAPPHRWLAIAVLFSIAGLTAIAIDESISLLSLAIGTPIGAFLALRSAERVEGWFRGARFIAVLRWTVALPTGAVTAGIVFLVLLEYDIDMLGEVLLPMASSITVFLYVCAIVAPSNREATILALTSVVGLITLVAFDDLADFDEMSVVIAWVVGTILAALLVRAKNWDGTPVRLLRWVLFLEAGTAAFFLTTHVFLQIAEPTVLFLRPCWLRLSPSTF